MCFLSLSQYHVTWIPNFARSSKVCLNIETPGALTSTTTLTITGITDAGVSMITIPFTIKIARTIIISVRTVIIVLVLLFVL